MATNELGLESETLSNLEERSKAIDDGAFVRALDHIIYDIKHSLLLKNLRYGNSALDPVWVFSDPDRISVEDKLNVRMDDKIKRLMNMRKNKHLFTSDSEDTVNDLLGYLILHRINQTLNK